jgi:hypothetical protein
VYASGDLLNEYQASPHLRGMNMPEVQHHMQHMRHLTFKRLTEQTGSSSSSGSGASRPAPVAVPPAAAAAAAAGATVGSGLQGLAAGLPGQPLATSPAGAASSGTGGLFTSVELGNMRNSAT